MRRYAEIYNGKVRAFGIAESLPVFSPSSGITAVWADQEVNEGDVYENGEFHTPTETELKAAARPAFDAQRAAFFADTEWIRQRHADRVDLGVNDAANWTAWLKYWQALRDMPEAEGFDPRTPVWPVQPE